MKLQSNSRSLFAGFATLAPAAFAAFLVAAPGRGASPQSDVRCAPDGARAEGCQDACACHASVEPKISGYSPCDDGQMVFVVDPYWNGCCDIGECPSDSCRFTVMVHANTGFHPGAPSACAWVVTARDGVNPPHPGPLVDNLDSYSVLGAGAPSLSFFADGSLPCGGFAIVELHAYNFDDGTSQSVRSAKLRCGSCGSLTTCGDPDVGGGGGEGGEPDQGGH